MKHILTTFILSIIALAAFSQPLQFNYFTTYNGNGTITNNTTGAAAVATNAAAGVAGNILNQRVLYLNPVGNADGLTFRGDINHPWTNLYSYDGVNKTGVAAVATNGDTIIVEPGFYVGFSVPLADGVSMIGVGNPTLFRTNQVVANGVSSNTTSSTFGPFVLLNNNTHVSGLTIVATNTIWGYDCCIGGDDSFSTNVITGINFKGATNAVVDNCVLWGSSDVFFGHYNSTYTIKNSILHSQWDSVVPSGSGGVSTTVFSINNSIYCMPTTNRNPNGIFNPGFDGSCLLISAPGFIYDYGSRLFTTTNLNAHLTTPDYNACVVNNNGDPAAQIILNGTVCYATNTANIFNLQAAQNDYGINGSFFDGLTNSYTLVGPQGSEVYIEPLGSIDLIPNPQNGLSPVPQVNMDGGLAHTDGSGNFTAVSFSGNGMGITNLQVKATATSSKTASAVTLTGSVFTFSNATPNVLECFFSGGTAYSVTKNGVAVYGSFIGDGYFLLQPTNKCAITYTVAPTFYTNQW